MGWARARARAKARVLVCLIGFHFLILSLYLQIDTESRRNVVRNSATSLAFPPGYMHIQYPRNSLSPTPVSNTAVKNYMTSHA